MKWSGILMTAAVLFLVGTGPAWAQTSSNATMSGPIRITDSPLGLLVGDYVGYGVVFVNPVTLALEETVLARDETALAVEGPVPVIAKPLGVAWMNGLVYVGDEKTGAIQVYQKNTAGQKNTDNQGKAKKVQKNTDNQGKAKKVAGWVQISASLTGTAIGGPADIVADEGVGLLFVASKTDKMVYVLDEAGALIRTIGAPGSTNPVGRPQGLALDRFGQRIYVSDDGAMDCGSLGCALASSVQVFDYFGNFLGAISGDSGQANFEFSRIQGVTVDSSGRVYLVDSYRGQVLAFDEISPNSWTGIGTFGSKGAGVKQLLLPMDVIVDEASATVYVTNNMKGRVEVFSMGDMVQW